MAFLASFNANVPILQKWKGCFSKKKKKKRERLPSRGKVERLRDLLENKMSHRRSCTNVKLCLHPYDKLYSKDRLFTTCVL